MVEAAFTFYKKPAQLMDKARGNVLDCDALVWDAELGLGRGVVVPRQNDGRTEIQTSHIGVLNVMPGALHERLEYTLDGKLQTFRIVGDVVIATPLYVLKFNKELQP